MQAFSYLRVSSRGQIEGDGFERQRDKIGIWAKANGVEIKDEYREEGISGTNERTSFCASVGLGSSENPEMRVMVGRMLRITSRSSVMYGVTFMTKPTGTVYAVVLKVCVTTASTPEEVVLVASISQ